MKQSTYFTYDFYDFQPGNRVGPILTAMKPTRGNDIILLLKNSEKWKKADFVGKAL